MTTTLFLQSDIQDPYKEYETMLSEAPVYWDHIEYEPVINARLPKKMLISLL